MTGKPRITANFYTGVQVLQSTIDLANGQELAYLSNLDAENRGAALPFPDLDNVPNVDWIDQVTESAPMTNVDVAVSGQTAEGKMNYYISGNYFNQKGIVRNSGIEKYIFRTNFDISASKKLKLGLRLNVTYLKNDNNKVALASLWNDGLTARAVYNEGSMFIGEKGRLLLPHWTFAKLIVNGKYEKVDIPELPGFLLICLPCKSTKHIELMTFIDFPGIGYGIFIEDINTLVAIHNGFSTNQRLQSFRKFSRKIAVPFVYI